MQWFISGLKFVANSVIRAKKLHVGNAYILVPSRYRPGGGKEEAPVFKGGYNAYTRKHVKKGHFFKQSMYVLILKRVLKTAKVGGKKGTFWTLEIVIGYTTHSRDQN